MISITWSYRWHWLASKLVRAHRKAVTTELNPGFVSRHCCSGSGKGFSHPSSAGSTACRRRLFFMDSGFILDHHATRRCCR
eukprot:g33695.t1